LITIDAGAQLVGVEWLDDEVVGLRLMPLIRCSRSCRPVTITTGVSRVRVAA